MFPINDPYVARGDEILGDVTDFAGRISPYFCNNMYQFLILTAAMTLVFLFSNFRTGD